MTKTNDETFVHPSSVVDEGVQIGRGTKVWHFCHISRGARLGQRCVLGQNVFVAPEVAIGDDVKIQNNVSVVRGVILQRGVFVGPSATFTNVVNPRAEIDRKDEFLPTLVGPGATIGANSTILCGVRVGAYAMVGAGAVVTHDVPDHALVVGNPGRVVGWVDEQGCRMTERPRSSVIPLLDTRAENAPLIDRLESAAQRVLRSGRFILGEEVEAFEQAVQLKFGVEAAVGVSSGSDALLLGLMALGVGKGDEVITTPFSFFSTVGAIVRSGARPVFVDIDAQTMNVATDRVLGAVTARTKVFLPVHLFGQSLELTNLRRDLNRRGVRVLEDAAQSFGAMTSDGPLGRTADLCCFSFFPSKNLGGFGDAGLLTTNDVELSRKLRMLRSHGATTKHHHLLIGGNFRMDALQAALLREKLPFVKELIASRRRNASTYLNLLSGAQGLQLPRALGPDHTYNQFVVRCERRQRIFEALSGAGIESAVYYPLPLHLQPALRFLGIPQGTFPRAEQAAEEVLALPIHPALSSNEIEKVAGAVLAILNSDEARPAQA